MAAKRSRTRAHRRDRRRAKATGWRREGKQAMGSRVGHGSGNTVGHVGTLKSRQLEAPRVKLTAKQRAKEGVRGGNAGEARGENLRVTLGELVVGKKS